MNTENYYRFQRPEMAAFLPKEYKTVLEIGCGEGHFTANFNVNVECWGVEMNATAAEQAREKFKRVIIGSYQDVHKQIPDGYFDVIVCNDVVEHMEHNEWFLQHIQSKLSISGKIVMSIPNVRYIGNLIEVLFFKDWRYKESGILDKTHLRFFTQKSLKRTLTQTGWSICKMKCINRYGKKAWGPKRLLSYLGQALLGWDTAYLQFGVQAEKTSLKHERYGLYVRTEGGGVIDSRHQE